MLISFTSQHYYFFEKLKIVEEQLCKLNCSYCKVSHALKGMCRHVILYYKNNLVYTFFFPQFLIFQHNNSAQTSVLISFTSRYYYFFEKLKIVEKQLCKLNCSYGKVSRTLKCRKI